VHQKAYCSLTFCSLTTMVRIGMASLVQFCRVSPATSLTLSAVLACCVLLIGLTGRAYAQSSLPSEVLAPISIQPNIAALQAQGHVFELGEVCKLLSGKAGIIKRDACHRWYCGRTNYQDITDWKPNFAAEAGCEWHLAGIHCLCQRPGARAPAK
jgi:hypothetical protein